MVLSLPRLKELDMNSSACMWACLDTPALVTPGPAVSLPLDSQHDVECLERALRPWHGALRYSSQLHLHLSAGCALLTSTLRALSAPGVFNNASRLCLSFFGTSFDEEAVRALPDVHTITFE